MGKNITLYIKNAMIIVRLAMEMEILLKINAFYAKMTESEHALFNLMRRVISGENMDKKYDWC